MVDALGCSFRWPICIYVFIWLYIHHAIAYLPNLSAHLHMIHACLPTLFHPFHSVVSIRIFISLPPPLSPNSFFLHSQTYLRLVNSYRGQVGVVKEGAGVQVDGWLSSPLRAHGPGGVNYTPEFRSCHIEWLALIRCRWLKGGMGTPRQGSSSYGREGGG